MVDQDYDAFLKGIMEMALVSIAASILAGLRGGIYTNVNQRLNIRVRKKLFKSLVFQDIAFFDEVKTGEETFMNFITLFYCNYTAVILTVCDICAYFTDIFPIYLVFNLCILNSRRKFLCVFSR